MPYIEEVTHLGISDGDSADTLYCSGSKYDSVSSPESTHPIFDTINFPGYSPIASQFSQRAWLGKSAMKFAISSYIPVPCFSLEDGVLSTSEVRRTVAQLYVCKIDTIFGSHRLVAL